MVQQHKIVFFAITLVFQSCLSMTEAYLLRLGDLISDLHEKKIYINHHDNKKLSMVIKNELMLCKDSGYQEMELLHKLISFQQLPASNYIIKLDTTSVSNSSCGQELFTIKKRTGSPLNTLIKLTQEILSAHAGHVGMFDAAFDFIVIDDTTTGVITVKKIYQSETKKMLSNIVTPSWGTITFGLLVVISFLVLS